MAMTAPITALYAIALGASEGAAALIVSVMVVSFLIVDLAGSRIVPRIDARSALIGGFLLFGVGSFASSVAPNLTVMVAARVLQGFAAAFPMGAGFHMALRLAESGREAREIARFNMCSFAGLTVGPLIVAVVAGVHARVAGGGDATELGGMRWGFFACGIINVVTAVVARAGLPSIPSSQKPEIGLPRRSLFAGRRVRLTLVASGLGFGLRSMFGMTLLPLLGVNVGAGLSGVATGTMLMAVSELGGIGASGRLADRHGRRPVAVAASALTAGGLLLALLGPSVPAYFALCVAMGVSLAALRVVPAAMIVDIAESDESAAVGWRLSCDLSTLVTAVLMAVALGAVGLSGGFVAATGVAVTVGVVVLLIGETRRSGALAALGSPGPALGGCPADAAGPRCEVVAVAVAADAARRRKADVA
jgi:MFS family permease